MKRTLLLTLGLAAGISLYSQTFRLHSMYDYYRGEEDVLTLFIPGFACRLACCLPDLERAERELLNSIRSIRIQVIENREINRKVNFARDFADVGNTGGYITMLEVHDGSDDVLVLAREKNGAVTELIVLAGGEENVMVWVKGRMNRDLLKCLYEITGIEECRYTKRI